MSIVIRSTVEPASIAGSVRQVVTEVDRTVPVSDVETMEHIVSSSVTQPRFNLFLLAFFSMFTSEDDKSGVAPVALISAELWSRKFASSPDVINKSMAFRRPRFAVDTQRR